MPLVSVTLFESDDSLVCSLLPFRKFLTKLRRLAEILYTASLMRIQLAVECFGIIDVGNNDGVLVFNC
jgi:hypothetical protein